jgi:hypothetical protein
MMATIPCAGKEIQGTVASDTCMLAVMLLA